MKKKSKHNTEESHQTMREVSQRIKKKEQSYKNTQKTLTKCNKYIRIKFLLFIQDCSGYLRILCFHTIYDIICSSSVKSTTGSLIRIALNLQIVLGSILMFTILILPVQEHGIFFYLFVSSLISFINILQFYIYVFFFLQVNLFLSILFFR